jgi:hypothetical protein
MKKYKYHLIMAVISLLILISCGKEDKVEPDFFNGFSSININGEAFEFQPRVTKSHGNDSTYNVLLAYFIGEHILRKQLSITFVLRSNEKQNLLKSDIFDKSNPQVGFSTRLQDGDVPGNRYCLLMEDSQEDFLQFTQFDESSGEIKGKFEASFVVDSTFNFDVNSPDTILITDGYFETFLSE